MLMLAVLNGAETCFYGETHTSVLASAALKSCA